MRIATAFPATILAIIALSACMRHNEFVRKDFLTSKPAAEVATCIRKAINLRGGVKLETANFDAAEPSSDDPTALSYEVVEQSDGTTLVRAAGKTYLHYIDLCTRS